jgi:hypothetical protein
MSRVFLHIPHTGSLAPEVLESIAAPPTFGTHEIQMTASGMSLLAMNFNGGWAAALNCKPRPDYFCMHHSDIGVGYDSAGWLDYMVDELERAGADVLSIVVPIKDARGLTSTGLLRREDGKHEHRRVTMRELDALPDTFTGQDVAALFGDVDGEAILTVNTGLWIARFDRPWVEDVCFTIKDKIGRNPDGTFTAHAWPEDWNFSEWCYDKGLRVVANKKVPVGHRGGTVFSSRARWGKDEGDGWAAQPAGDL